MAKRPKTDSETSSDSQNDGDRAPRDLAIARLHVWQIQAVRDVLIVAAGVGLVWIGYALRTVTVPLLVALLLAYLFEPLVRRLCRHPKISRPTVAGGLIAVGSLGLVLAAAILVPVMLHQTKSMMRDFQSGSLRPRVAQLTKALPERFQEDFAIAVEPYLPDHRGDGADPLLPYLDDAPAPRAPDGDETDAAPSLEPEPALTRAAIEALVDDRIAQNERRRGTVRDGNVGRLVALSRGGFQAVIAVIGAVISVSLLAFLIPFYFFFFVVWWPDVVRFGHGLIPRTQRTRTIDLLQKMDDVVAGFVRGRIIISLIMGMMLALGWYACGVPYALAVGLLIGVLCAVPYLGGVGIPVAVLLLVYRELGQPADERLAWWLILLLPTAVFVVVQVVEGYVLTPVIAGQATNLDPVTILVAVLAGGSVLGVYGMLLAIPVAACGKIFATEIMFPKIKAWTRGEASDPLPIDR